MGARKGRPKPEKSGRKKGSVNKYKTARELFAELKFDPAKALYELLPQLTPETQVKALATLLQYHQPMFKPKDDETVAPTPVNNVTVNIPTEALLNAVKK